MNIKVFSVLTAILIIVIAVLGGAYYYLFEYSSSPEIPNYSNTNTPQNQNYNQNAKNNIQEQNIPSINTQTQEPTSIQELTPAIQEIQKEVKTQNSQNDKKDEIKTQKTTENTPKKDENPLKLVQDSQNSKTKLSTIKEYQERGKDSRLEPELSTETIKVYVMDGKALSDYRIGLLKDMLEPVQNRSKDYNLSVFIEMLPQNEMSISIYNKDIIFSDRKKSYRYITMDKLKPYLNNPESLNSKVKREQIIERVSFQIDTHSGGSAFSKHIRSLKNGLNTAQYFFPFCEIIYIDSKK
ncbi:MAG: hypothetical protein J1D99_00850 [Campylobacter sp.]|nr:hypothetical protein [Campylobacter sp.]